MSRRKVTDQALLRTVGGEIQARRRRCGMSQEDLAAVAHIHRNTLGKIERGACDASIVALSYLYFLMDCSGVLVDRCGVVPLSIPGVSFSSVPEIADMRPATMISLLSKVIKARRVAAGLSLRETADASAIHLNSLWNFETGLVCPAITTYHHLLRALEVSAVTLSEGVPQLL